MKVLIIGLDGFLSDNYMPNLRRLKVGGYSGVLQSTEPPTIPAAWTTCINGCNPQKHGILVFREYSFKDDSLRIGNATSAEA
jgi:predicted AlkP superfamily phosphohydrolase/phosphomutase